MFRLHIAFQSKTVCSYCHQNVEVGTRLPKQGFKDGQNSNKDLINVLRSNMIIFFFRPVPLQQTDIEENNLCMAREHESQGLGRGEKGCGMGSHKTRKDYSFGNVHRFKMFVCIPDKGLPFLLASKLLSGSTYSKSTTMFLPRPANCLTFTRVTAFCRASTRPSCSRSNKAAEINKTVLTIIYLINVHDTLGKEYQEIGV